MDFLETLQQSASDIWNDFDLTKFLDSATRAYVQIRQANQAATTVAAPGTVRRLPDGSTARINADGSMTVIDANGQARTVGTSGRITAGHAEWIAGVPNVVTILGAGLLAWAALRFARG